MESDQMKKDMNLRAVLYVVKKQNVQYISQRVIEVKKKMPITLNDDELHELRRIFNNYDIDFTYHFIETENVSSTTNNNDNYFIDINENDNSDIQ